LSSCLSKDCQSAHVQTSVKTPQLAAAQIYSESDAPLEAFLLKKYPSVFAKPFGVLHTLTDGHRQGENTVMCKRQFRQVAVSQFHPPNGPEFLPPAPVAAPSWTVLPLLKFSPPPKWPIQIQIQKIRFVGTYGATASYLLVLLQMPHYLCTPIQCLDFPVRFAY
jgi:hypothetical protein